MTSDDIHLVVSRIVSIIGKIGTNRRGVKRKYFLSYNLISQMKEEYGIDSDIVFLPTTKQMLARITRSRFTVNITADYCGGLHIPDR